MIFHHVDYCAEADVPEIRRNWKTEARICEESERTECVIVLSSLPDISCHGFNIITFFTFSTMFIDCSPPLAICVIHLCELLVAICVIYLSRAGFLVLISGTMNLD